MQATSAGTDGSRMRIGLVVSAAVCGVGWLLAASELATPPALPFVTCWLLVSSVPAVLERTFSSIDPRHDGDFARGVVAYSMAELVVLGGLTLSGNHWDNMRCAMGLPVGLLAFTEGVMWLHAERASEGFALDALLSLDWLPHSRAWARLSHPRRRSIEVLWWSGALGAAALAALMQIGAL